MNIKCVITDIDGTLLNDKKELTIDNYKAIKKLKENGIYFILASGRYLETVDVNLDYWNIREYVDYVIHTNGYGLYNTKNRTNITFDDLDQKSCEKIVKTYINKKCDIAFFDLKGRTIKATKVNKPVSFMSKFANLELVNPEFFCSKSLPKLGIAFDDEQSDEVIKIGDFLIKNENFYSVLSGSNVYEFLNRKVSKAKTAIRLIESLNIKNEETIVFGDNDNDIEMLEVFINSVAMANATENAKKAAKDLTISNNDSGIADYIIRNVL